MIELSAFGTIDMVIDELKRKSDENNGELVHCVFNGKDIYSNETEDEIYIKVTTCTRAEMEEKRRKSREEYERRKREHREKIPELTEKYRKEARGVILESQYSYWDEIVPIRLGDLYDGMELGATLEICRIMGDNSVDYDKRLHEAYDAFMKQEHSHNSAGLVASMLRTFCPCGYDIADAVINFRYDKENCNKKA